MSRKPESVFSTSVHKYLPKTLYRVKNNNPFAGGIPDFWFSGPRGDLWVEYKFVKTLSKNGTAVTLSPLQTQWLRDRHMEGRNVAVIVGCKGGGFILRNLAWENTIPPEKHVLDIMTRSSIARWIQSEVGESNDQVRSRNLPDTRRVTESLGERAPDLRGLVRRPARQGPRDQPQPSQ